MTKIAKLHRNSLLPDSPHGEPRARKARVLHLPAYLDANENPITDPQDVDEVAWGYPRLAVAKVRLRVEGTVALRVVEPTLTLLYNY